MGKCFYIASTRYSLMLLLLSSFVYAEKVTFSNNSYGSIYTNMNNKKQSHQPHVFKHVFDNGMTLLVRSVHQIPKVSLQLWYKVGSKDEKTGEKGIAHLIEHMIFKGTKELLSESDINDVTHMLSGSCNAFTSYDYTGYLFNMPTQHWKKMLPIMADCMQNARFDEQMLSSEMKAVIQELKMYKDRYVRSMLEDLIGAVFPDHPYHYPIIGFKQDLWSANSDLLHAFYKKHYLPNNATLVVVGDVDPQDVVKEVESQFGHLDPNFNYKKEIFYHNKDISSKSVTLYRDIAQPLSLLSFVVPGESAKMDHVITAFEWVLGKGKSSRLYQKLVNELQLVTSIEVGSDSLFDYSLFFIAFEAKDGVEIADIEKEIFATLRELAAEGPTLQECERAAHQMRKSLYSILEDMEQQAYSIGQYFTATGDENYVFDSFEVDPVRLCPEIQAFASHYFKTVHAHRGAVLAIPEDERDAWIEVQEQSDAMDDHILSAHQRTTDVEPARYAKTIEVGDPESFSFPKADAYTLSNNVKLLYYHNGNTPKITLVISFRAQSAYDPENKVGIGNFVSRMLSEGTKNYSAEQFAHEIESRGMSFSPYAGGITIHALKKDLPFALDMARDVLDNALFDEAHVEKVRDQILAEIKNFWDEPRYFSGQLIKDRLYEGHPYSKNSLGSKETIASLSRDDLYNYYKSYISPDGARIAIVGDINSYDVPTLVQEKLGTWHGPTVEKLQFPALKVGTPFVLNHPINRDQVVLAFAKHSIRRNNKNYDKLLLFNQIFGGGALGSMSSRLFQLRERSGLFYTISGSLLVGADEEPGLFLVKTIVSRDRLDEAERVIKKEIDFAASTITQQDLEEAKRAVIHSLVDNFASNSSIATTVLYLDRFNLPADYFDKRAHRLQAITVKDVQSAVKDIMKSGDMLTVRVGRI